MNDNPNKFANFWKELKRRKVIGVIIVYATTAFILLQLVDLIKDPLNLPQWVMTFFIVLLASGFPIAIIFSWFFDFSSKGIVKTDPEIITENQNLTEQQKSAPYKSIIVLPFENISSDPEQEYFSDGLTEEIITDLSYINDLLVISRSSAMTFKGTKKKIKEIASDVNVQYVLEGSIRKSGNDLRIVAQLIDALTDTHLWAEKYSGTLDDIFDIQEKVSRSIADNLKIKLSDEEIVLLETASFRSSRVYELYQKAKYEFYYFNEERLKRALEYLEKALEIEGENVQLYFMKGMIYFNLLNVSENINYDYLEKAKTYASKVFELQPESPLGYSLVGFLTFFEGNVKNAVIYLQRSFIKNPDDAFVLLSLILGYFYTGNSEKAYNAGEKFIKIDPFNPVILILKALIEFMKNNKKAALSNSQEAHEKFSEVPQVQLYYAYFLLVDNQKEESVNIFNELIGKNPETIFATMGKLFNCAIKEEDPERIMSPEIMEKLKMDAEWVWLVADSYALMNNKEKALELLEYIVDRGFINFPLLSEYDPFLHILHSETRFKKLMKRVKKEWENFEV